MKNEQYATKRTARALAALTGSSYQQCLQAVEGRDLSRFVGPALEGTLETVAVGLTAAGLYPSLTDARLELLETTLATLVVAEHPRAVTAIVGEEYDADSGDHIGYLSVVLLADGTEVEGFATALGDRCFTLAGLLLAEADDPYNAGHEVDLTAR